MVSLKTTSRNRLKLAIGIILCLTKNNPDIQKLGHFKQSQVSH